MSAGKRRARRLCPVSVKAGSADVYIEGVIGEDVTAANVREQIAAAKGAKSLTVHINSEGGVITEGMAIYAALRSFDGPKTGIVEGIAASMASVVLQACDQRVVNKGAFVMIHNPSATAGGEARDLRSTADLLDKMRGEILDIYEARSGQQRSELEEMVNAETYFTAEEAVAAGLADSVEGGAEAHISVRAVARLNPEKIPEALRALAQKENRMNAEEEKQLRSKLKALEEENARLKAEAEDEEEDKRAEEEDEGEEEPKHDTHAEEESDEDESDEDGDKDGDEDGDKKEARAILRTVRQLTGKRSLAEAHGRLVAITQSAGATLRDARANAVKKLIADGKLLPAMKGWALKASPKAFASYVSSVGDSQVAPIGKKYTAPAAEQTDSSEASSAEMKFAKAFGKGKDFAISSRKANPLGHKEGK